MLLHSGSAWIVFAPVVTQSQASRSNLVAPHAGDPRRPLSSSSATPTSLSVSLSSTESSIPTRKNQQLGQFEALNVGNERRQVRLLDDTTSSPLSFQAAWDLQKDLLQQHVQRRKQEKASSNDPVDTILLLQHEPTYTLGTRSDHRYCRFDDDSNTTIHGISVVPIDRGGEVTYHGPGQLVVYLVLDLQSYRPDLHWYMRALEEAVLVALRLCSQDDAGDTTTQHPLLTAAHRDIDTTGVWVDDYKVAAMGVKVRQQWITQHGLAVNVEHSSLVGFDSDHIVPCGLEGRKVGCVNQFLQRPVTVGEFAKYMETALKQVFEIELVR